MRILYDLRDGTVLDNSGTSDAMPEGPPDDDLRNLPDGVDPANVGIVRLHDVKDAEKVAELLANRHHIDPATGSPVVDGPVTPAAEDDPDADLRTRLTSFRDSATGQAKALADILLGTDPGAVGRVAANPKQQ